MPPEPTSDNIRLVSSMRFALASSASRPTKLVSGGVSLSVRSPRVP